MALPEDGKIIVFEEVPAGSLCRAGAAYRVERHGREFLLVSVDTGHASRDTVANVDASKWSESDSAAKKAETTEPLVPIFPVVPEPDETA